MLQISEIRKNKEDVIKRLAVKNFDGKIIIENLLQLDVKRKHLQFELDQTLNESNQLAKKIGTFFKNGDLQEANKFKGQGLILKEKTALLQKDLQVVVHEINEQSESIPNVPHPSVKKGNKPEDNEIIFQSEKLPEIQGYCLPHWELGIKHKILDFETGTKITGSGFPLYIGKGAALLRSLINFLLDCAREAGYMEIIPPLLVNEDSAFGTGQLPDKDGQMYFIPGDNLYLIPTAEVPLTNIYRNMILEEKQLPVKLTGYTPCFRKEAGSYGKDVKGLNRVHQFDKVEIVQIVHPEKSYGTLEEMKSYVESVVQKLQLPYKIIKLCGGEMSFSNALCYDFEVYSAAQKKWLEISSVSNFESFQANRLKLRFKNESEKPRLLHTLNGSALGLARTFAALLENNQTDTSIIIPEILIPYTGFKNIP